MFMNEAFRDALLKVDSYGAIFMYATHKDLTTAPRHIVRMTEPVDPRVLAAVRTALDRYPQFALGLVRGETQYNYRILTKPPKILPMDDLSPYYIGSDDTNGYLFLCGYKDNTIYLEYQHCISDGAVLTSSSVRSCIITSRAWGTMSIPVGQSAPTKPSLHRRTARMVIFVCAACRNQMPTITRISLLSTCLSLTAATMTMN